MAASLVLTTTTTIICWWMMRKRRRRSSQNPGGTSNNHHYHHQVGFDDYSAYEALIGNTPMVKLYRLSAILRRNIYVKMENMNPGGTGKDRAALGMIRAAEKAGDLPVLCGSGYLKDIVCAGNGVASANDAMDVSILEAMKSSTTGGLIVEGTSGSTGISLAALAKSSGHACLVVLPDDQASEKAVILKSLGAVVHVVATASISNPNHYVNVARRLAGRAKSRFNIQAVFIDQFENPANFQIHYRETGPELFRQCRFDLQAFCMSSGTGGTISGVGKYIKERSLSCRIVLVDPPGSSLYNKVMHGVCYSSQQAERSLKRHRYDTIAEGIGLDRVTKNLQAGLGSIDSAVQVSDQEALDMAHWLLQNEGLWVGSRCV
jgi:cysteine synthase A